MEDGHEAHPGGGEAGRPSCGRSLTTDELERARERAAHVIVLMLENRSFDHMLGYLDHPDRAEFDGFLNTPPDPIPIPIDINDPSAGTVPPSDDAEPRLGVDPPHGHVSALMQIDEVRGTSRMDGFATAYAQKIGGKEDVPVIRWDRIVKVTPALAAVLAAAGYDVARMGVAGGWVDYLPWLAGGVVVTGGAASALKLTKIPGLSSRTNALVVIGPAVVLSLAAQGWWRWLTGDRGWAGWPLSTWALLLLAVGTAKKRYVQLARVPAGEVREESMRIMRCMHPSQVPVLAKLAMEFAVCTRWYSSVPGATWPNRNFAHAGTSDESVDIELGLYNDPTIFDRLDDVHEPPPSDDPDPTWRIYFDKVPQVVAFSRLWRHGRRIKNWFPLPQIVEDIAAYRPGTNETLPMYTFVEPRHMGEGTNSQHPGNNEAYGSDDFERGEALIAAIYDALVANPALFKKTVFLITYDEHGGFYDHVAPPRAVPPDPLRQRERDLARNVVSWFAAHKKRSFPFTQLGVRVPTVVVSPWIRPGRVCRCPYDHTSIPASVRRLFAPGAPPLSVREAAAQDILHLLVEQPAATAPTPTTPDMVSAEPFFFDGPEPVRAGPAIHARGLDDFDRQLLAIQDEMRRPVARAAAEQRSRGFAEGEVASVESTPTMELFESLANSTRNGNPLPEDF